ncbi:MAG: hypothetical protein ACXVDW_18050 [Bacteroidia bacterium]
MPENSPKKSKVPFKILLSLLVFLGTSIASSGVGMLTGKLGASILIGMGFSLIFIVLLLFIMEYYID